MAKVHDWNRVYWTNASGSREYNEFDGEVPETVRAVYENDHGDTVDYRLADEDAEHGQKYEVRFAENGDLENAQLIEGVEFSEDESNADMGWFAVDEESDEELEDFLTVEQAVFGTRAAAREFSRAWRELRGAPEDLGYVDYDEQEILDMEYSEAQEIASELGIKQSQSHEELAAQISGEAEPEYTKEHEQPA